MASNAELPRSFKKLAYPVYYLVPEEDGTTTNLMIMIDPERLGKVCFRPPRDDSCPDGDWVLERPAGIEGPWKVSSLELVRGPGPGMCYEVGGQTYCW